MLEFAGVVGVITALVALVTSLYTMFSRVNRKAYEDTITALQKYNQKMQARVDKIERANSDLVEQNLDLLDQLEDTKKREADLLARVEVIERHYALWREGALRLLRQMDGLKIKPDWTPPAELVETPPTKQTGPRSPLGGRQ